MPKRTHLCRALLFLGPIFCLTLFAFERHVLSADTPAQDPPKPDQTFEKVVQPFFANNCYECHNEDRHTAGLNLEALNTLAAFSKDPAVMKRVLDRVKSGQMPPAQQPRPKPEDITAVTDWLNKQTAPLSENKIGISATDVAAAHVTVRR